ncbi:MAG: nif-specific transcriptional activator NifA [Zetaproteobacteria bacterium CG_4_9_14_3_um_filter_49_83]|nr:MAG: nif-specific transcriptional activator NifA [Zetaproteobacteria bacterium CG17_big_fil_post_rev_8_21_14_2_50_50_13]PIY54722.1 MAG: nif-specific transcriptional activator NifA [Zetaproteobacteria bacterium CG_4_10_14_0_8_um_filter_49_80]PJA34111.1 MAG: nif-specific transcriptional activator NifA [Zetaproteobacteria bacterium CG_4_9_14_3_um_filter_49_83]
MDKSHMNDGPGFIDRNSLIEAELEALFQVSCVLSRSLNLHETLKAVLEVLNDQAGMERGIVTLRDQRSDKLKIKAVHGLAPEVVAEVSYQPGEGILGTILEDGQAMVIERLDQEPEFLDRLGYYDPTLPFLAEPIIIGNLDPVGVIAAQPAPGRVMLLHERARFLKMVANLIAQSVRLSWEVDNEKQTLKSERDQLRQVVQGSYSFDNIVGHTEVMRRVFEQVQQVSKWNTTVLIRGESGTGKELIANAIHYNSPRSSESFIKLNCAALPDNLLESELFGHEKGAFTGAINQRKGRFEQADGGTIFLDEIGEITPAFQAKLLRVLQEGEFERVGGTKTLKVNVRVVAATNRNLEQEVEDGDFREDLYYRLNVMPINLPSLHERVEDIPDLAAYLVDKIARQQGRKLSLSDSAVRVLMRYNWPGNVRELENCLERAAVMCSDGSIDAQVIGLTGIEEKLYNGPSVPKAAPAKRAATTTYDDPDMDERERVIAALEQTGWVQAKAARLLNMTPRQIAYRIQTLNIKVQKI